MQRPPKWTHRFYHYFYPDGMTLVVATADPDTVNAVAVSYFGAVATNVHVEGVYVQDESGNWKYDREKRGNPTGRHPLTRNSTRDWILAYLKARGESKRADAIAAFQAIYPRRADVAARALARNFRTLKNWNLVDSRKAMGENGYFHSLWFLRSEEPSPVADAPASLSPLGDVTESDGPLD